MAGSGIPEKDLVPSRISNSSSQIVQWYAGLPPVGRTVIKTVSAASLFGVTAWFLAEFIQLRGIVHLLASRILLAFATIACSGVLWIITTTISKKHARNASRIAGVIFLVVTSLGLDYWAPRPGQESPAALVMNIECNRIAAPMRLDPGTTLTITNPQGLRTRGGSTSCTREGKPS